MGEEVTSLHGSHLFHHYIHIPLHQTSWIEAAHNLKCFITNSVWWCTQCQNISPPVFRNLAVASMKKKISSLHKQLWFIIQGHSSIFLIISVFSVFSRNHLSAMYHLIKNKIHLHSTRSVYFSFFTQILFPTLFTARNCSDYVLWKTQMENWDSCSSRYNFWNWRGEMRRWCIDQWGRGAHAEPEEYLGWCEHQKQEKKSITTKVKETDDSNTSKGEEWGR